MLRVLVLGTFAVSVFSICVAQVVVPEGRLEHWTEIEPREVTDGIRARIVRGDTVTYMRIEGDKGGQTLDHNHAHEQFVSITSGRVRALVGGNEYILEPGDTLVVPSWTRHTFHALEDSVWHEVHGRGFGGGGAQAR